MLTIRRVLFPTDFSEAAARAFPQAAFLADWHDAELHVVNVTEPSTSPDNGPKPDLPVPLDTLTDWLGRTAPESGPRLDELSIVQTQVESGMPAERLVAYVEDRDVDLVVMGTHGRRGIRRMLLGSVTEEVVRKASCPVLTVRTDAPDAPRKAVRRILVPVDFSDAAETAVAHANEIAQTYGAEIDLLHVIEEVVYPSAYGVEMPPISSDAVGARVEESLGTIARDEIGHEHVQISATIGYAPLSILDYVEENDVDLVVIATHGRTGLDRVLLGSVTERVLRQSPVPVFVVPPDGKSLVPSAKIEAAARE
jgi:nucleotide-binding universal stress UspA family protein